MEGHISDFEYVSGPRTYARTHARTHTLVTGTMQLYTLCLAVVLITVVNSSSTNMSYYYYQTLTSDFEQQLDYSKAHYSSYVFLACRGCHVDPCDTEACAGDVAAPTSGPHLAADLFLRASAHFGVLQQFFLSRNCQ